MTQNPVAGVGGYTPPDLVLEVSGPQGAYEPDQAVGLY
jgi:hypothetical protein